MFVLLKKQTENSFFSREMEVYGSRNQATGMRIRGTGAALPNQLRQKEKSVYLPVLLPSPTAGILGRG